MKHVGGTARERVHGALRALEAEVREVALVALANWERADVTSPELFTPIANLQRPTFGMWNGLLQALRSARRSALRTASDSERTRITAARDVEAVLRVIFDESLAKNDAFEPLGRLVAIPVRRLNRARLIEMVIALRNRVAHDLVDADDWWDTADEALSAVTRLFAEQPILGQVSPVREEPWFRHEDDGSISTFAGITDDLAVRYVGPSASREPDVQRAPAMLRSFQRLLGKSDVQELDFRKVLARIAPNEEKGVLLGDFVVGRVVGSGGFANVHSGRQLATGRRVAIKILRVDLDADAVLRFQQEAAYLSRISHPNIVGVVGYGQDPWYAPRHVSLSSESWFAAFQQSGPIKTYLALDWIEGRTLEQLIGHEQVSVDTLLDWFEQAAHALQAVHAAGLIHRDIKPANLMVTDDGVIKLMDFGIARTQDDDRTRLTRTGTHVGTLAYMSPEQLEAREAEAGVGPATDLYGLCATFYELVVGKRIFDHDRESPDAVRAAKLAGALPIAPRTLNRRLSWELEMLLLGGLQRDPADRFRSAADLARDVHNVRAQLPIEYRRPSLRRRIVLTYRRNRAVFQIALASVTILVLAVSIFVWRLVIARDVAERERASAIDRADDLVLAQAEYSIAPEPAQTLAWLKTLSTRFRRWPDARALAIEAHGVGAPRYTLDLPPGFSDEVAISTDGERVAMAAGDHVHIVELSTGATHDIVEHATVGRLAFVSPTELVVAAGGGLHIWPVDGHATAPRSALETDKGRPDALEVSPSGRWIAAAYPGTNAYDTKDEPRDSQIWFWNPGAGTSRNYPRPTPAWGIHFDREEHRALAIGQQKNVMLYGEADIDRGVTVFDLASGTSNDLCCVKRGESATDNVVNDAAFGSGDTIVAATSGGSIAVWTGGDGHVLSFPDQSFYSVAVVGDTAIAEAAGKGVVAMDVKTHATRVHPVEEHVGHVEALGDEVVVSGALALLDPYNLQLTHFGGTTGAGDLTLARDRRRGITHDLHQIRVWDLDSLEFRRIRGGTVPIADFAASADLTRWATVDREGEVRVWTDAHSTVLVDADGVARNVAISDDGTHVATASRTQLLITSGTTRESVALEYPENPETWDLDSAEEAARRRDAPPPVAMTGDGAVVLTARSEHEALLWSRTGSKTVSIPGNRLRGIAISKDQRCALLSTSSSLVVVALPGAQVIATLTPEASDGGTRMEQVSSPALAPDCSQLAYVYESDEVRIYDLPGASLVRKIAPDLATWALAFTDGPDLLIANQSGRLWETSTHEGALRELPQVEDGVNTLVVLPDGKHVLGYGTVIAVWDLAKGKVRTLMHRDEHAGPGAVAASADGAYVVAAVNGSPFLYTWDSRLPQGEALRAWLDKAVDLDQRQPRRGP